MPPLIDRRSPARLLAIVVALAGCLAGAPRAHALPSVPGDLDENGHASIADAVRLVLHLDGAQPFAAELAPFADLDQDAAITGEDLGVETGVILGRIDPATLVTRLTSSPAPGEGGVAVTRETILRFGRPLAASVTPTDDDVHAEFGGQPLQATMNLSPDRRTLTLFYLLRLPDSSRIHVTVDGTSLFDAFGMPVDVDGDGAAGGTGHVDFDTLTLSTLDGTTVFGRVFASEPSESGGETVDVPLKGVTVTVDGLEATSTAVTDDSGNFTLSPAPAGPFFVHVNGETATDVGSNDFYPVVGKLWQGEAGLATNIGDVYLPLITSGTLQDVSPSQPTTIEFPDGVLSKFPELEGTQVTVPPNALYSDTGERGGQVGIAPVAPDRLPGKLPEGLDFPLVITVQASAGMTNFDAPVPTCFPNLPDPTTGLTLAAGDKTALWSYDHDAGEWRVIGPMTISEDGTLACTDPGVGILAPGWHGTQPGGQVNTPPPMPPPCQGFGTGDAWDLGKSVWDCFQKITGTLRVLGKVFDAISAIKNIVSDIATLQDKYAKGELDREGLKAGVDALKSAKDLAIATYTAFIDEDPVAKSLAIAQCASNLVATVTNILCKPECLESSTAKKACDAALKLTGIADALIQKADVLRMAVTSAPLAAVTSGIDALVAALGGTSPVREGVVAAVGPTDPDPELLALMDDIIDSGNAFTSAHEEAGNETNETLDELMDPMIDETEAANQFVFDTGGHGNAYWRFTTSAGVQRGQASAAGQIQLLVPPDTAYVLELFDAATNALSTAMAMTPANGARGTTPPFEIQFLDGAPDMDGDALADAAEAVIGTDPTKPDTDMDGLLDGAEALQGTNPLDGTPARTGIIGTVHTPNNSALDICAANDLAVVAEGDAGVSVFNVFNGMNPTIVAQIDTPGSAQAVACAGNLIAVADGSSGLAVIDRTTSPPSLVRQVGVGGTAQAVTIAGDVAFVGLASGSIVSVDMRSGRVLDRLKVGDVVFDLGIEGVNLFAIVDVSLQSFEIAGGALEPLGTAPTSGRIAEGRTGRKRLFVGGGLAYATSYPGYDVFDVHDPAAPVRVGSAVDGTVNSFKQVVANGSGLGVAAVGVNPSDGTHDVSIYDLSDPTKTNQFVATFPTPGITRAVSIYNGLAYVADDGASMQVINYLAYDAQGVPPTISLSTNYALNQAEEGQLLLLRATVNDDVQVRNVEFHVDDTKVETDGNFPFEHRFVAPLITPEVTSITVRARATDTGGNATWTDPLVLTLVPDATPPRVRAVSPRAGAYEAAVDTVAVTFSEPMDAATLTDDNFGLFSEGMDGELDTGDDVRVTGATITYRDEITTAFLAIPGGLPPASYRAFVTTDVTDRVGNALQAPYSWSFLVFSSTDMDGDGLPDDVETEIGTNPDNPDTNGNGVPDGEEDLDFDDLTNACEVRAGTDPTEDDTDANETPDAEEDPDADGLSNEEECDLGTDPRNADTDGDGMPDGFEAKHDLDPLDPTDAAEDKDADGLTNLAEYTAGTDPTNPDTMPPVVVAVHPPNASSGHPRNGSVSACFSELMDPQSFGEDDVQVLLAGVPVFGVLTAPDDVTCVTFAPAGALAPSTAYTFRVAGGRDRAGNPLAMTSQTTFTTGADSDSTPPSVVRVSPPANATGVPVNSPYTVEFNEPVDPVTLRQNAFRVVDTLTGQVVAGVRQLDATGRLASFVPDAPLPVARQFYAELNGVRDAAQNLLAYQYYYFTTGFDPDTTAPIILGISPANGLANVPTNAHVVVEFNEPMSNVDLVEGIRLTQGALTVDTVLTLTNSNRRVTLVPTDPLDDSTAYQVHVEGVSDLARNALASSLTTSFTTGAATDTMAPTVTLSSPLNGATGVPTNAVLSVHFSERIDPLTVDQSSYSFYDYVDNQYRPLSISVAADQLSATFTPTSPLVGSRTYQLYVNSNVKDLAGNALVDFQTTFATGPSAPDSQGPQVILVSPPNGNSQVPANAPVRILLNEDPDPLTVNSSSLTLKDGATPIAGTVSLSGRVIKLTPSGLLGASRTLTVNASGFRDAAGNLAVPFQSTFTTLNPSAADTLAPTIFSTSPVQGATNVSRTTSIAVTFGETLDPLSVDASSFRVTVDGVNGIHPGTTTVADKVVTFTPSAPFPGNATVRLFVDYYTNVTDLAGNNTPSAQLAFQTTAMGDMTSPTVVSVTPTDGATDVPRTTPVTLTFSEPLNPATIVYPSFALLVDGVGQSYALSHSDDNTVVKLAATLPSNVAVTVVATSDVRDLAGNALAPFQSSFTTSTATDYARPTLVGMRPGDGATRVDPDTSVVLFASEPLDPDTVLAGLRVAADGALVAGTIDVSGDGRTIEFFPGASLPANALVMVFGTTDIHDVAGNALQAFSASFRVLPDPSAEGAHVVRTSPTGNDVPRNAVVEVEYSEPLAPSTVNGTNVTMYDSVGAQYVPGSVATAGGDRVIRFMPGSLLTAESTHSLSAYNIHDLDGGSSQNAFVSFVTSDVTDTMAPTVLQVSPPDGATAVGVNAEIRLRFSEPVNPLTVGPSTVEVSNGGPAVMPYSVAFANGNRDVIIVPHDPLDDASTYTITVDGVTDVAANAVSPFDSSFQTRVGPDTSAPQVLRVTPPVNATNVPPSTIVSFETDEPMSPPSVDAVTFRVVDTVTGQAVPGTSSVDASGRRITFVPDHALAVGRQHYAEYNGPRDVSGNLLPYGYWYFTTSFTPDTTRPHVVGVSPADGLASVPKNVRVVIDFDEPVSAEGLAPSIELEAGAVSVDVSVSLSNANRRVTLTPLASLATNTLHTLTVGSVKDLSGNTLLPLFTSDFTTGTGVDLIQPTSTGSNPINGATGVPINADVTVKFSERINPLTAEPASFLFYDYVDNVYLPGTIDVAPDQLSATFTPQVPLTGSRPYQLYVTGGVLDLAGNTFATVQVNFTTGVSGTDTQAPTVTRVNPPDGATGVPVNATVRVTLSEPPDPLSVSASSLTLKDGATPIAGTVSQSGSVLTFTPNTALTTSRPLTVNASGFKDVAGNTATPFASTFTTSASATPDSTAPAVTMTVPAQAATGVSRTAAVVATFSEPIDPVSVDTNSFRMTVDGVSGVHPGTTSVSGSQVTFTPSVPFPGNATVRLYVNYNTSVRDVAGNNASSFQLSFLTVNSGDMTPPTVLNVTPANGATDVPRSTPATLTFSEPLDPNTVTYQNFALLIDDVPQGYTLTRSEDNTVVTLAATHPSGTTVAVIATNGVRDLAGNPLAGFQSTFQTSGAPDHTRPTIVAVRPGDGATRVDAGTTIVLFANEPLDPATAEDGLHVSANGVLVAGTVDVSGEGTTIEFTPDDPFDANAFVMVFATSDIEDDTGNALQGFGSSFRILPDPSTETAFVTRTSPSGSNVPRNAVIEVEYSGALDGATVDAADATLFDSGISANVPGMLSLVGGGRILRFVPSSTLSAGSGQFFNSGNYDDLEGMPANGAGVSFTTGATTDSVGPHVVAISPPDGAMDVGINTEVRVRFDEPVNVLSVNASTIALSSGGPGVMASSISFSSDNREVTIVPKTPLDASENYTVTVSGVTDLALNAATAAAATFETGAGADTTAPALLRFTPPANATNVPRNATVEIDVSEPLSPPSVNAATFRLVDAMSGQPVPATTTLDANGRHATVVPDAPLTASHQFYAEMNGMRDVSGNLLAYGYWYFTTSAATDATGPHVVKLSPPATTTGVPTNVRIFVDFDEPVSAISVVGGARLSQGGNPVSVTTSLSNGNRRLNINPAQPLAKSLSHTITIDGVRDLAHNLISPTSTTSFTTGVSADVDPPDVVTFNPANGATAVSVNVVLSVTFNERVDPVTADLSSFQLYNYSTGTYVDGTVAVAGDLLSATFTPSAPLSAATQYQLYVSGALLDLAGNGLNAAAASFTTQ